AEGRTHRCGRVRGRPRRSRVACRQGWKWCGPAQQAAAPRLDGHRECALNHDEDLVHVGMDVQRGAGAGLDYAAAGPAGDTLLLSREGEGAIARAPWNLTSLFVCDDGHALLFQ